MNGKLVLQRLESVGRGNPIDSDQIANAIRSATTPFCQEVVAVIKRMIKKPKTTPEGKLELLQAFCACMRVNNEHFQRAASEKILRRLGVFASHRKDSTDPRRGMDLFKSKSMEQIVASQEFFTLLLENIEEWAFALGDENPSYRSLYNELLCSGVAFPKYSIRESTEMQLKRLPGKELVSSLRARLAAGASEDEIQSYIIALKDRVEKLKSSLSRPSMETLRLEVVFTEIEELSTALEEAHQPRQPPAPPAAPPAVDQSPRLIAQAQASFFPVVEPGSLPVPPQLLDDQGAMDEDLRPDLVIPPGMESPSIRYKPSYHTIKRKVVNEFRPNVCQ